NTAMNSREELKTPENGGDEFAQGGSACPTDARIFAYYENRLQFVARKKIERHLGSCERCRESLALLIRLPQEEQSAGVVPAEAFEGGRGEANKAQVARVLAMIERDEAQRERRFRPARRVWIPLPVPALAGIAALVVLAIGAVLIYNLTES